jgi:hypothetical protein
MRKKEEEDQMERPPKTASKFSDLNAHTAAGGKLIDFYLGKKKPEQQVIFST